MGSTAPGHSNIDGNEVEDLFARDCEDLYTGCFTQLKRDLKSCGVEDIRLGAVDSCSILIVVELMWLQLFSGGQTHLQI